VLKLGLLLFMTGFGVAGGLIYAPFVPAAMYYGFAVLRPQFIWEDALDSYVRRDFPWSMILALATIGAALVARISVWVAPKRFANIALPRFNSGHVLLGIFAVWVTLSYMNALRPEVARPFYEDYRKIFLMFFVTSLVMVSVRQVWLLYLVVLFPLMYIAFEVNEIYLLNSRYNFIYRRGFAGLDNNGAALLLSMGAPLCVYAWDGVKHWIRWVFPVGIALIVHAVLLSYSRGAMLALLLTSPLYLIRARHKKMIVAGYIAALAVAPVLVGDQIAARFGTISESEKDASAQNRFTTWEIAWRMANERPFFGFGIRNSSEFTHDYGADEQGRVIHSTYLQIAADSGLVGLIAYLGFLAGAFYCANRARMSSRDRLAAEKGDRDDRFAYAAACGAEGSLAVFVIGGAFLSLETFEPPYIVALIAVQLWSILKMKNAQTGFERLPTE
jgi:probable O-glycosylation ligase (exosortase A-associated)